METAEQATFEKRYWEAVRRQTLAPDIGRVAISNGLETRRRQELTTGLAEAIDGIVVSDWPFKLHEGKLVADDGQELEEILQSGLQDAIRTASSDSFYAGFLPHRARHELDELRELQAVANGQTSYNAVITLSPYTEELAGDSDNNLKLRAANQKPDWQRSMIRVSRWDGEQLHISTRSLDNSSVDLLKQTARGVLGYEYKAENSTDMLGERIHLSLRSNQVADELIAGADDILANQRGGSWRQGRQENAHDTQKYVESQEAILQEFYRADLELALSYSDYEQYKKAFHKQLYNYSALLENRLLLGKADEPMHDVAGAAVASGNSARAEGKVYDMCGLVLTAAGENTGNAVKTGMESLLRLLGKKVECPSCKEKVVIPEEKLKKGVLCCKECKFEIDACTGEVYKKSKKVKPAPQPEQPKNESDWQRIVREDEEKKAELKLRYQQERLARKAA